MGLRRHHSPQMPPRGLYLRPRSPHHLPRCPLLQIRPTHLPLALTLAPCPWPHPRPTAAPAPGLGAPAILPVGWEQKPHRLPPASPARRPWLRNGLAHAPLVSRAPPPWNPQDQTHCQTPLLPILRRSQFRTSLQTRSRCRAERPPDSAPCRFLRARRSASHFHQWLHALDPWMLPWFRSPQIDVAALWILQPAAGAPWTPPAASFLSMLSTRWLMPPAISWLIL